MALAAIKARVVTLAAINDLIKRSLAAVKIHAHLESTGISQSDGKQPDGATIVPWKGEQVLVWDATCPDTFAPSHITLATRGQCCGQWSRAEKETEVLLPHDQPSLCPH